MTIRLKQMALYGGLLAVVALLPRFGSPVRIQASNEQLVLAFYYAWYDHKTWNSGQVPDVPLVPYASANAEAMARQIDQAKGAGIDAFVLNWWGKGNQTEKNLKTLLDLSAQRGFRLAIDFDLNSPFMGGVSSYADNLRHLHSVHTAHPAYLRYQGRPVVFFFNVSRLSVSAWQNLRDQADPGRNALWIAEGTDLSYQAVFDGHHLYSITWPNRIPPSKILPKWGSRVRKYNADHGTAKVWVATVMPGYDDRKVRPGQGFARSRDGGDYYRQCWQAAIDSKPHMVVVNSFNEWPEGSYIEPSQAYGNLYLDLTREWAARLRGTEASLHAVPTSSPPPTQVPPQPTPKPQPPDLLVRARPIPILMQVDRLPTRLGWADHCGFAYASAGPQQIWIFYCMSERKGTEPRILVQ